MRGIFPSSRPIRAASWCSRAATLKPEKLYELLEGEQVTITCGVPSFWLILTDWLDRTGRRFSKLRVTLSSGSAPPRSLIDKLERDYGVEHVQAWGMTEALMSTCASLKPGLGELPPEQRAEQPEIRPRNLRREDAHRRRRGARAAARGKTFGHLRVKGPWIARGYLKDEASALDADGYLRTGDIAVIDPEGHVTLTDRSKDVIKSGGEWISSIQLEDAAASHPDVLQCAVIAVPHPKWQERPLLLVMRRQGATLDAATFVAHIRPKVAKWWLPTRSSFSMRFP